MKLRIPIFREGSYPQLREKLGIARADAAFLRKIAEGTALMMKRTKWRPRVKGGHGEKRETLGWIEEAPTVNGTRIEAVLDFNADGAALIKAKKARFVSAEIDRNVSVFGDDDSERVEYRVRAVALLGDEDPQIKDLCDLTEEAAFGAVENSGVVVYFSEFNFEEATEEDMTAEEKKKLEDEAAKKKADDEAAAAKKKVDEDAIEKKRLDDEEAEKTKASATTLETLATSVASLTKTVGDLVARVSGLSTPEAIAAHAEVANFSEIARARLAPSVAKSTVATFTAADDATRKKIRREVETMAPLVPFVGFSDSDGGEDEPGKITAATFAEAANDTAKGAKIDKAFRAAQRKNPKLTFSEFRAEVLG